MRISLFIIIFQSLLLLGHWFAYTTLVRFFPVSHPGWLLTVRIVFGLLSISLIPATLLASRLSDLWVRCVYSTITAWVGFVYLFILASAGCWMIYGIAKVFKLPAHQRLFIRVSIGLVAAAGLYGIFNSERIRVTRVHIQIDRLPNEWKNKTAVWVSDSHLGPVRNIGFSRRVAAMVRQLHPDIVFIGGDLFDGQPVDLDRLAEPFSGMTARYGTYFVTGNHEEFGDKTPYLQAVRRAGIRILDNEMVDLDGLQLIGVDYRDTRAKEQFQTLLRGMKIDRKKPSILLKHVPLNLEVPYEEGISVQLSGHTHRGQLLFFRFITSQVYKGYDYGLNPFRDLQVYTSSGVGTWGPPMRIDTKPEIVLITFM